MSIDEHALRTLIAGFLAGRASPGTRDAYRRDLGHLAQALGVPAAIPDDEQVSAAFGVEDDPGVRAAARTLAALPADWWRDWRDGLEGSAATRRRRVAAVRAFCRWWSRVLDLENPVRDLRPPGGAVRRGRPGQEVVALAPAATRRLCEAARRPGPLGARDGALVELLYGCGLRASEAASLDVSACHLDDAEDPYVVVTGKGRKTRAVAVPVAARDALVAYLRVGRPALRASAGPGARGDADAVFLSVRGRRLGRADIWRIVTRAASRAGLTDDGGRVFPHALRHSCGTHLIQAGVDIRYVQAHLGHASPVTTEVYTHVTAAHLREDFDRAHPRARAGASAER
jgi:integrase/recombinase XerD